MADNLGHPVLDVRTFILKSNESKRCLLTHNILHLLYGNMHTGKGSKILIQTQKSGEQ